MATIDPANLISMTDAVIDLDISGDGDFVVSRTVQCESTQLIPSNGSTQTSDRSVLCGDTFTLLGANNPVTVTLTALYTDGQTADLHEDALAASPLQNAAIRWSKSGTAGEQRHIVVGALLRLLPPPLSNDGSSDFELIIIGEYTPETIV